MCAQQSDTLVRPPLPDGQRAALDMALDAVPNQRRAEYIARLLSTLDDQAVLPGLIVAQRHGQLCGAILMQLQPGRVAAVWPPVVREADNDVCLNGLLDEAARWLVRQGVRVAQVLLPNGAHEQAASLERHGFAPFAELLSMTSFLSQSPTSAPRLALRLDPAFEKAAGPGEADAGRLAAVVERTYEGTLDCPALNGVRAVGDVLASYRACGKFDPARWFIACRGAHDVGCLLLTDHADTDQSEIVYVGLVPEERGRGTGLALTRHAQWLARQAGRSRLVLAVDAANAPAVAAYHAAGFIVHDSRRALIRIFPDEQSE